MKKIERLRLAEGFADPTEAGQLITNYFCNKWGAHPGEQQDRVEAKAYEHEGQPLRFSTRQIAAALAKLRSQRKITADNTCVAAWRAMNQYSGGALRSIVERTLVSTDAMKSLTTQGYVRGKGTCQPHTSEIRCLLPLPPVPGMALDNASLVMLLQKLKGVRGAEQSEEGSLLSKNVREGFDLGSKLWDVDVARMVRLSSASIDSTGECFPKHIEASEPDADGEVVTTLELHDEKKRRMRANASMSAYGGYSRERADAWFAELSKPGVDANGRPQPVPNADQLNVLRSIRQRCELEWWEASQAIPRINETLGKEPLRMMVQGLLHLVPYGVGL